MLLECTSDCERGNRPEHALEWIQKNGVPLAVARPYAPENLDCNMELLAEEHATIGYFSEVNGIPAIDKQLKHRPVLLSLEKTPLWQHWSGYSVKAEKPPLLNAKPHPGHSVVIVGTARAPWGHEYYIIRNTWGVTWGVEGHALLPKSSKFFSTAYTVGNFTWQRQERTSKGKDEL